MTWTNNIAVTIGLGFIVTVLLTPLLRRFGHGLNLVDVPNERSSHFVPTPRTGGIAILVGIIVALAATGVLWERTTTWVLAAAVVLGAVSLCDDLRPLPRHFRLVAQILVAVAGVTLMRPVTSAIELPAVGTIPLGLLAGPLLVFWVVGVTNAFNFMDGINGIASLQAIICAATYGTFMVASGDVGGGAFSGAIAGASAGFLLWNLNGSIFMGDVGSAGLGYLLSLLAIGASKFAPAVAVVMPLFPFLFDSAYTLVRRALRGEKWFSTPHRSHLYQRLVSTGLTHVTVSLLYAALALVSSAVAVFYGGLSDAGRIISVILLILIHLTIVPATTLLESRRKIVPV